MKKAMSLGLAIGLLLIWEGGALPADRWALGTSGAGSGPYVWGAWISKIVSKYQNKVIVSSQATAGYNENVELVHAGKIQLGMTIENDLLDAYRGMAHFRGRLHERLRKIFIFNLSVVHIVTREGAGIKNLAELKGKKVNISLPAMATRKVSEDILKAANIGLDEIKKFEMATGSSFPSLQDRVIDATINGYSIGHGELMELANNIKIRLIDVPEDVFAKVNRMRENTFLPVDIPANSYKGQTQTVKTFAFGNVLFTRDDAPEEAVYLLTKAFWDNLPEVQKDVSFKIMKKEYALIMTGVPLHPGAQKDFKEVGIVK